MIRARPLALGRLAGCLLGCLLAAGAARAEPAEAPGFATLARIGEHPTLGVAIGLSDGEPSTGAAGAARFDLYGWTPLGGGWGIHAQAALSLAEVTAVEPDASGAGGPQPIDGSTPTPALWGAVVGGHWLLRLPRGGIPLAAAVILPTASGSADADAARRDGRPGRVTDTAAALDPATWARLSASPWLDDGRLRARVDLGADLPLSGDADPLLRLNLGLAGRIGPVAATGELAVISAADIHLMALSGAVGARYVAAPWRPGLHVVLPIGALAKDDAPWWTLSLEWAPSPGDAGG